MAMIPLYAMVRKDLQLFFSDRKAVIMSFVVPIVIASFFGFVFQGANSGSGPSPIAIIVANQDSGAIATSIVASIQADKTLAVTMMAADSGRDAVRRGKAVVTVVIPAGFGDAAGRAFFGGQNKPELEFTYDPSHAAELGMVRGILTGHVLESVSQEMFGGTRGQVLTEESLRDLDSTVMPDDLKQRIRALLDAEQKFYAGNAASAAPGTARAPGLSVPYTVKENAATASPGAGYNSYAHAFAGMGVQFLLFAAIDLGIGILLERQRGLWKRLRSAPLSRRMLLGGKTLSGTVITLLSLLVSFTFAILVCGVRIQGSVPGFLAVAVATALMASTFGLLIASLGNTPGATRGVSMLAVLVMVMLGGAWIPTFLFPAWIRSATVVIPTRWAIDGLDAMTWRGIGISGAVAPTLVLLGYAVVFAGLAIVRFRWEEA